MDRDEGIGTLYPPDPKTGKDTHNLTSGTSSTYICWDFKPYINNPVTIGRQCFILHQWALGCNSHHQFSGPQPIHLQYILHILLCSAPCATQPMAYFCVQFLAVPSYFDLSVLYMWAISGTRGSSGLGSVSSEHIDNSTCQPQLVTTWFPNWLLSKGKSAMIYQKYIMKPHSHDNNNSYTAPLCQANVFERHNVIQAFTMVTKERKLPKSRIMSQMK